MKEEERLGVIRGFRGRRWLGEIKRKENLLRHTYLKAS